MLPRARTLGEAIWDQGTIALEAGENVVGCDEDAEVTRQEFHAAMPALSVRGTR
jgi:hypothetical protein